MAHDRHLRQQQAASASSNSYVASVAGIHCGVALATIYISALLVRKSVLRLYL